MTEPTTAAGRLAQAVQAHFDRTAIPVDSLRPTEHAMLDALAAYEIEAEARQQDGAALRSVAQAVVLAATKHTPEIVALNRILAALPPSAPPTLDVERPEIGRWLTPDAKAREVAEWLRSRVRGDIPDTAGGLGFPDPLIFEWTDRINAVPHVCTLQSCTGHGPSAEQGTWPGELWLWLTQAAARAAYGRLPELELLPNIVLVRLLMVSGQEVLDVQFEGADDGSTLATALEPLIAWLARLGPER